MNIKNILVNFFIQTDPRYAVLLVAKVVLIAAGFWLVYRFRPRWRYWAYSILLVFLIRLILFGQWISWGFYNDHLTVDDLGWRPQSVLHVEYYKFFKNTRTLDFLAVGSSQTNSVYTPYSKKHNDMIVFNVAGMAPLDIYLYRKYIAAIHPRHILLYLSEFDLANAPRLDAAKSAPAQGFSLSDIFPALLDVSRKTHSAADLNEMVAGEFFPEYKYAFIFKGFADKIMRKNQSLGAASLYAQLSPSQDELKKNAADMVDGMDEQWIPVNMYFLSKFMSYCRGQSLKVVIVEGQYNPVAFNEKAASLNRKVREALEGVTKDFDNVVFVPRSEVLLFSSDDYSDVMHVKPEAGVRFVERLMGRLQK